MSYGQCQRGTAKWPFGAVLVRGLILTSRYKVFNVKAQAQAKVLHTIIDSVGEILVVYVWSEFEVEDKLVRL